LNKLIEQDRFRELGPNVRGGVEAISNEGKYNMQIGIAADHGGFNLKEELANILRAAGHKLTDYGAHTFTPNDDYPDFVVPLARAVAAGGLERGIAVCGSGVGAAVCANKVPGIRASLISDHFSARQGVEDDDMNILCLGGRAVGQMVAQDIVESFLNAKFSRGERHMRRLLKIAGLEIEQRKRE